MLVFVNCLTVRLENMWILGKTKEYPCKKVPKIPGVLKASPLTKSTKNKDEMKLRIDDFWRRFRLKLIESLKIMFCMSKSMLKLVWRSKVWKKKILSTICFFTSEMVDVFINYFQWLPQVIKDFFEPFIDQKTIIMVKTHEKVPGWR